MHGSGSIAMMMVAMLGGLKIHWRQLRVGSSPTDDKAGRSATSGNGRGVLLLCRNGIGRLLATTPSRQRERGGCMGVAALP